MRKIVTLVTHTVTSQHILYYTVSKNRNEMYEEAELYEYGIKCTLCDLRGKFLEEQEVKCISANFNLVRQLTRILRDNQVYPVHLLEILDDIMTREVLEENDKVSLACL